MMNKLALAIHENEAGEIRVQILKGNKEAYQSFCNLHGRLGDPPSRVTLVTISYDEGNATVRAKNLPVQDLPKDKQPDGIVLGKGPIWLDKEEEGNDGKADSRNSGEGSQSSGEQNQNAGRRGVGA